MKYTLLEIVQEILSDMDSDEVNSISDTTESLQVAGIVKETYYHLVSQNDLPEHKDLLNLSESGDTLFPVKMSVPSYALKVYWVKYNKILSGETDPNFEVVEYLPWSEFIEKQNALNLDSSSISSMSVTTSNSDTWSLKFYNERHPSYWSSPDDDNIYFDAILKYESQGTLSADPFTTTNTSTSVTVNHVNHGRVAGDIVTFSGATAVGGLTVSGEYTVDSVTDLDNYVIIDDETASSSATGGGSSVAYTYHTDVDPQYLQKSKIQAYGLIEPTFTLSDSYTPDIDATEFNWFVNEAKKAAFAKLKQVRDPIADERAKRGWVRSQRNREKTPANVPTYSRFNNLGRQR